MKQNNRSITPIRINQNINNNNDNDIIKSPEVFQSVHNNIYNLNNSNNINKINDINKKIIPYPFLYEMILD